MKSWSRFRPWKNHALAGLALLLASASIRAADKPPEAAPEALPSRPARAGTLLFKTAARARGATLPSPATDTDVVIRVAGIVARTEVSQRFRNATGECVDGIYVFPLPEGAAVDRLQMTVGGRIIEGEIREREEAKKAYEQARSEGRKASLLEQERPNVFTVSVASIGADEEIQVSLAYQEAVRYDDGRFHLRFPMVVAPRYVPGSTVRASASGEPGGASRGEARVPDADRISPAVLHPSRGPVNPVHLRVELDPGFPLRRVTSGTHGVLARAAAGGSYLVTLSDEATFADRDFELAWEPDLGREPKAAVLTQTLSGETYALLLVVPPAPEVLPGARLPRETVFVIDTSGSMAGASIDGAKRALGLALARLQPEDRFNVIEFNSRVRKLYPESRRAFPGAVDEARRWVGTLEAQGGTEMLDALESALDGSAGDGQVRQVLFMTDGAVGNEEELFHFIQAHLGRSRLFTVGLGSAPNSHFMTRAAEFGRGTFTYVSSSAEVDEKMSALFRRLEAPVLTNLELVWDDASAEAWPAKVPDLYAGEPLVVVARLSTAGGGVTVRGDRSSLPWSRRLDLEGGSADSGIDRLWARRKIAALTDSASGETGRAAIRCQVVEVALAHHLISSYTSLVAVDVTPTVARGTVCEPRPVPVNLPAGWDYESVFGELPSTATPARLLFLAALGLAALASALWGLGRGRP